MQNLNSSKMEKPKTEIIKNLKESPLFNLSLASKELFHSNFLYWLWSNKKTRPIFINIIESWTDVKYEEESWKNLEVKREFLNLDLCIVDNNEKILVALENKVKSIPYLAQLEEYVAKVNEHNKTEINNDASSYILLSLSELFPNREKINEKWKIKSYEDLYKILNDNIENPKVESYNKFIINDYCQFINGLHCLQKEWKITCDSAYFYNDKAEEEIRIHDLCRKIRCAQMLLELNKEFNNAVFGATIENIRKNVKKGVKPRQFVYLNFGMTHGIGIIDVKILFNKKFLLGVQVQGDHYRHVLEYLDSKGANLHDDVKQLSFFREKFNEGKWNKSPSETSVTDSILEENIYPNKPKSKEGKDPNFNSYGTGFFYQSRKIKKDSTIGDLIKLIKSDIDQIGTI